MFLLPTLTRRHLNSEAEKGASGKVEHFMFSEIKTKSKFGKNQYDDYLFVSNADWNNINST